MDTCARAQPAPAQLGALLGHGAASDALARRPAGPERGRALGQRWAPAQQRAAGAVPCRRARSKAVGSGSGPVASGLRVCPYRLSARTRGGQSGSNTQHACWAPRGANWLDQPAPAGGGRAGACSLRRLRHRSRLRPSRAIAVALRARAPQGMACLALRAGQLASGRAGSTTYCALGKGAQPAADAVPCGLGAAKPCGMS